MAVLGAVVLTLCPGISSSWHQAVPGGQGHLTCWGGPQRASQRSVGATQGAMLGGREKVSSHRHVGLSSQAAHKFFPRGGKRLGSGDSQPVGRPGSKGQRHPEEAQATVRKALETANRLDLGQNIQVSGTEGSLRKASLGAIVSGASGQRRTVTKQADAARGPSPIKESLLPELEKGAPYSGPRLAL